MKTSDIQPGDLFDPELEDSTLIVVPAHMVLDGQLMSLDSGFLFDARNALGARFALEAGGAARRDNRGGAYGFSAIRNPIKDRRGYRAAHGVGILQSRFSWWETPDLKLIKQGFTALRKWMVANKGFPVRVGCPGLPYVPKERIVEIINDEIPTYLQHRLTVISRRQPTTAAAFSACCPAPTVPAGNIAGFLPWKEGNDG